MPQLVRAGLRTDRWLETEGRRPQDFPADVISDLRTAGDELSLFEVTDAITAERIAIAVAAGKTRPAHTGYAVVDRAAIERLGVLRRTTGDTIDPVVNTAHFDLHVGTAGNLLELAGTLADGDIVTILKKRVAELLRAGFENGQLDHRRNRLLCEAVRTNIVWQEEIPPVNDES